MPIRLPCAPKRYDEASEPLRAAIDAAALASGLDYRQTAIVLTHALEGIAAQLTKGRLVRIPGFGAFGTRLITGKRGNFRRGGPRMRQPCPVPVFHASAGFRAQVRDETPVNEVTHRKIDEYRRNHSCRKKAWPESSRQGVRPAMFAWRQTIARQIREEP